MGEDLDKSDRNREIYMFVEEAREIQRATSFWQTGMGTGHSANYSQLYVGQADSNQGCMDLVKNLQPFANGASVSNGFFCFAEYGPEALDLNWGSFYNNIHLDRIASYYGYTNNNTIAKKLETFPLAEGAIPISMWRNGDQSGNGVFLGGVQSYQDCLNLVVEMQPMASSATLNSGLYCYAEFGMTGVDTSGDRISYETVIFDWIEEGESENAICKEV